MEPVVHPPQGARLRRGLQIALLAALFVALIATAGAQGQTCLDFDNLTVCADLPLSSPDPGSDTFTLKGNITIGPKGQPAQLIVRDASDASFPSSGPLAELREAVFISKLKLNDGRTVTVLHGDIFFVDDKSNKPLIRPKLVRGGSGFLLVDTRNLTITTPRAEEAIVKDPNHARNEAFALDFLDRAAIRAFFAGNGTVEELSRVEPVIDLNNKRFSASVPLDLKLLSSGENPDVRVTARLNIDSKGTFSGTMDAFKLRIAGMLASLEGVTIADGGFEAKTVTMLKGDNPDLPSFDPKDPQVILRFEKLRYKDGALSVAGGEASIPDWVFSSAFQLTSNSLGLSFDSATKTTFMTIKSQLAFANSEGPLGEANNRRFPITLRIGAQRVGGKLFPAGSASLSTGSKPVLSLHPLGLTPDDLTLVFDPAKDFYGITSEKLTLRWVSAGGTLGDRTSTVEKLELGVNKNNRVIFRVGAGQLDLPPIDSKVLAIELSGTIARDDKGVTALTATGVARLKITGNSGVAPSLSMIVRRGPNVRSFCHPAATSCVKAQEFKLGSFELKIAGFTLGMQNPQFRDDGGFAVSQASLKLPLGVSGFGGKVSNFSVTGAGDIKIAGGGFELPPLGVGGVQFVGVKGSFARVDSGYEFRGAGTLPLPGLDPSGGRKLEVDLRIVTDSGNRLREIDTTLAFTARPGSGVVLGGGMELTRVAGSFSVRSQTFAISIEAQASSQARLLGTPLVTAEGQLTAQFRPTKFTGNAQLSVLFFKVAQAQIGYGQGQGFSGGDGFNASFEVDVVLARGDVSLRLGKVTVNGRKQDRVAAQASLSVGIPKHRFGKLLPPFNINVSSLKFQGGSFTVREGSRTSEQVGVMSTVGCCFFLKATVFYNLSTRDLSIVNAKDYTLIDAAQVRALAARQVAGYRSLTLSPGEAQALGISAAQAQAGPLLQDTVPVLVEEGGTTLFGINYPAGAPSIRLQLPDGSILAEGDIDDVSSTFIRNTATGAEGHDLAFVLQNAAPGAYALIIDNAPAAYEQVFYTLNAGPELGDVTASCGGDPISDVVVSCDGASAGGSVSVSWNASDRDSADAKVRVGYVRVPTDTAELDLTDVQRIAEDLPLGPGSASWDLSEVASGQYRIVITVEDGQHAPVETIADLVIDVDDRRAPAVPRDLVAEPLPGELLITWAPGAELDLAGYEIGFGVVQADRPDDPANFIYSRDMGSKEVVLTTTNVLDAKLWGLSDDEEVFVGIRAYDQSGNLSAWSPLLRAKPWPLSPAAWTPVPGGKGQSEVVIAFETPLQATTLEQALVLRDASGVEVPGRLEQITNLDGDQVIGLRFVPARSLQSGASYTATLAGGPGGIQAADGRRMPADYSWSFTATNSEIYLPFTAR